LSMSLTPYAAQLLSWRKKNRQILLAESELRQAQKMEAVGQAVSIIAHDFRNVLMPITGSIDLLRRRLPPGGDKDRILHILEDACSRGSALVDDFLVFARREENSNFALHDINHLLEQDMAALRQGLRAGITLEVSFEENLPKILLDPSLLSRVLSNLVTNAQDAMPAGGAVMVRTSRARPPDEPSPREYVCLAVIDTGTGIPQDMHQKIFEPFFTTKPSGQGTGLGLAMVAGFVQKAKGRLTVDSAPGAGTTIKIYFPLAAQ